MKKFMALVVLLTMYNQVCLAKEPLPSKGGPMLEKATFAGGCFWCVESPFEDLKDVKEAVSGYTGGHTQNPTYEEVCSGETGHYEAVEVTYDLKEISFEDLLNVFWQNIDPTDPNGQFVDQGSQYRTAIFYHNGEQKHAAEESKKKLVQSGRFKSPIVTEIIPAVTFYKAEEHHQNYCRINPVHYKFYRAGSGRDQFLDKVWGKDRKH